MHDGGRRVNSKTLQKIRQWLLQNLPCAASPLKQPYRSKISPSLLTPQTTRHPYKESAAESPMRRMIGAYGDTGRPHAQTRKSQLGSSHCARPGARHRIRAAGHATATHGRDVYLLA